MYFPFLLSFAQILFCLMAAFCLLFEKLDIDSKVWKLTDPRPSHAATLRFRWHIVKLVEFLRFTVMLLVHKLTVSHKAVKEILLPVF